MKVIATYFKLILILIFPIEISGQTEYIIQVNPTNGTFTKIDSIPGVRYVQINSAAYNEATKEYTVIGYYQSGQSPAYLYTINALTGTIISKSSPIAFNSFISLRYSRTTGILYGLIYQNGVYNLATINKTTGSYLLIKEIPNIDAVGSFVIDEEKQYLYLSIVDHNPSFALLTIDLLTGNKIHHVSTPLLVELQYDNFNHKLYALTNNPGTTPPNNPIISLCLVNPTTGSITLIKDLPLVTGISSGDNSTFDEDEQTYFFAGTEQTTPVNLFSVNASTGDIINKTPIASSGVIDHDNLIFFRFDNSSRKLYGLFWEAKTIPTQSELGDSICKLDYQTKVYINPGNHSLVVDKKITKCKVSLNLYNMLGQLIVKNKIINDGYNEIKIPNLPKGIYCYKLMSERYILLSGQILKP
ncbi:MAG TPA: T9SS type A sorting domain-containing protein [Chitinophagaceae bacterium]|nr:T9SS type A sorting domain-containing protein [Chitinophagaceae bacterium]HPG11277.1 T9SS type A sorting domain-containing protein [Chitinophagaceae bacterium]